MKKSHSVPVIVILAAMLVGSFATIPAVAQQEHEVEYSGKEVYRLFCILCHGARGQGSPLGKTITRGEPLTRTDAEILDIITNGRPEQGMMGFASGLSRNELLNVTEYIRELQGKSIKARVRILERAAAAVATSTADAKRGEELFRGEAGCFKCHSYYTQGGQIGPAMDTLASRLSPEDIKKAVESPSSDVLPEYKVKEIVRADGTAHRGIFRADTKDTIEILNSRGDLWTTYFKSDLKSLTTYRKSLMPEGLLADLSEGDQDSLYAFLASLK